MIRMELEIKYITEYGRRRVFRVSDTETTLDLSEKRISHIDLAPLSRCTQLWRLDLWGNRLESIDLTPLSSCTQLRGVDLSYNSLQSVDLSPLAGCAQRIDLRVDDGVRLVADRSVMSALKRVLGRSIFSRVIYS